MSTAPLRLLLYVAGDAPNSRRAIANLELLRATAAPDACVVEVVDVFDHPERALADGVLLTPMLVADAGVRVVGTLDHPDVLLGALGLKRTG